LTALGSGDGSLIRLHATQFLLLAGAIVVILVERQIERAGQSPLAAAVPHLREPRRRLAGLTAPTG
jgi:hypothetical protein